MENLTEKTKEGLLALRQLAIINIITENREFREIVENYLKIKTYCKINNIKTNQLKNASEKLENELIYRDNEIKKEMIKILREKQCKQ